LFRIAALAGAAFGLAAPASAELVRANDSGFVTRHEVVVEATPKDVWLALIAPATWWRAEHTWSGDAKNLTLTPQAGGCFCETIPEVDEPGRFTLQGSVEHMRVVQAYPEQALRMTGALGPLQSEPVTGVLTIVISTVKQGTRIVLEYNVGGPMRYEVPVISKAVDGVMGAQLASLGKLLGPVAMPAPVAPPPVETAPTDAAAAPADAPEKARAGAGESKAAPAAPAIKAAPVLGPATKPAAPAPAPPPAPAPAAKPAGKVPSVEDAFADLDKDPAA
jgi:uncharacterized protein YndB with AHSA1/START domain